MRIITHNIRYATGSPFKGELPWPSRFPPLLSELRFLTRYPADDTFLCLQEVLHNQLLDILGGLNKSVANGKSVKGDAQEWAYIGVGRDDGATKGEYSPLFYRPAAWELLRWEPVWLSETPDKPSKGWDAASIRILTVGVFRSKKTGEIVLGMSTHLDDQGRVAREGAAQVILSVIKEYLSGSGRGQGIGKISAYFLAGDFNSTAHQEAHTVLTAPSSGLCDAHDVVMSSPGDSFGNENTFTGFGYEGEPPKRIDYVLLSCEPNGEAVVKEKGQAMPSLQWNVLGYTCLPARFDDGVYLSDHRPVIVDAEIKPKAKPSAVCCCS